MHTHTHSQGTHQHADVLSQTREWIQTRKNIVCTIHSISAVWLAYYTHANVVPSVEKVPLKISSICFESGRRKQR